MMSKEDFEKLEYLDMYSKAELIVRAVFKNIRDKGGNPYLDHLYYVSDNLKDINMKIVGLLHDLIEDTDITYNDLLEVGFTKNIIDAVELLTKKEEYDKYIDRIINSNNKISNSVLPFIVGQLDSRLLSARFEPIFLPNQNYLKKYLTFPNICVIIQT